MIMLALVILSVTAIAVSQAMASPESGGQVTQQLSPWTAFFIGLLPLIIDKILTYVQSNRKLFHEEKIEEAKSLKQETETFRRELREENERLREYIEGLETKNETLSNKRIELEDKIRTLQDLVRKFRVDPATGRLMCARIDNNCPFGKTADDVPDLQNLLSDKKVNEE